MKHCLLLSFHASCQDSEVCSFKSIKLRQEGCLDADNSCHLVFQRFEGDWIKLHPQPSACWSTSWVHQVASSSQGQYWAINSHPNSHSHPRTSGSCQLAFGLWEEVGVTNENPRRHRTNTQTAHSKSPSGNFTLNLLAVRPLFHPLNLHLLHN